MFDKELKEQYLERFNQFLEWWKEDTNLLIKVDEELIRRQLSPTSSHLSYLFKCKDEVEAMQFVGFTKFLDLIKGTELEIVFSNLSVLMKLINECPVNIYLNNVNGKLEYSYISPVPINGQ